MIRKIPEDVQAEIATLVASDQYADEESVIREGVELFGEQVRSCSGLRPLFGGIALTTLLFVAITAVGAAENGPKDKPRKQGTPRRGTLAEAAARNNKVPDALAGIEKDLALYYSFDDDDEKVYDLSGNDLHGRTVGNVQYQPSFRGRAAKFTSNKTYVLCDDLNMDKWRNLTVSAWINTNRITAHAQVFSCGEVTGEQMSGFVMQVGGESKAAWNVVTEFQGRSRQGQIVYTSSLLASRMKRIGKWVHLTGVFDGKHVKFYINGKLDCQNETANNGPVMWNPKSHKLVIGNTANKSRMAWMDKYFDGLVDEVKVWKRSLTAQQIAAMHAKDANEVEQWEQKKTLLADFHRGSYKPVAVYASDVWQDAGPENVLDGNVQTFWGRQTRARLDRVGSRKASQVGADRLDLFANRAVREFASPVGFRSTHRRRSTTSKTRLYVSTEDWTAPSPAVSFPQGDGWTLCASANGADQELRLAGLE